MAREINNILLLNHEEVMNFFMKSELYHGFELPEYFCFDEGLQYVRKTIEYTPYEDCINKGILAEAPSDVNLGILLNNDERYAVCSNPYLYYFFVHENS